MKRALTILLSLMCLALWNSHGYGLTPIEDEPVPGLLEQRRGVDKFERVGTELCLAIILNHSQTIPLTDPVTRKRLHPCAGLLQIKKLHAIAASLENHPDVHCTANLPPFLLIHLFKTIDAYERREPVDELTLRPAADLTGDDQLELTDAELEALKSTVPLYKKLQDEGQIEVITAPFANPVLPLIYDTDLAGESMPDTPLPKRFSYPKDVESQVRLAVELHQDKFGRRPRGIMPAGGSVSEELIPLLSRFSVQWWVSGKGVLARSLGMESLPPEELYRPYRVARDGAKLSVVFGTNHFSDSDCLLRRLYTIHRGTAEWEDPPLVILILDSTWEHHLSLYSKLSGADWVKTVTVGEYLAQYPATREIENLWSGSWVNSDFSAWIGEKEENLAWEYLLEARETVENARGKVSAGKVELALQYIYAAEGSHWFWHYGEDHSPDDPHLDEVYRRTLKNVYYGLGFTPPVCLDKTILQGTFGATEGEPEKPVFSMQDPEGDDYGPGTYTYPTDGSFSPGVFDLLRFEVLASERDVIFRLKFRELTNPWGAPLGFSHQLVNLYLCTHSTERSSTTTRRKGANVRFDHKNPWNYLIKVAGWPGYGGIVYSAKGKGIGECEVNCDLEEETIRVSVPKSLIGEPEGSSWGYYLLIGSQDGFGPDHYRPVAEVASRWVGGGNSKGPDAPRVYDILDPASNGKTQEEMLGSYRPEEGEPAIIYPVIAP